MDGKKSINYYMNLRWTYTIETTIENGKILYIVHLNEIHRISTDVPSVEEAMMASFEMYISKTMKRFLNPYKKKIINYRSLIEPHPKDII